MKNKTLLGTLIFSLSCMFASSMVSATVVEVRTNLGDFQVNLYDSATPLTVANFLSYVNSGAYANNTVHRSSENFVIQMGGFQYNNSFPPDAIATGAPVTNEPVLSNRRGTLAMAKLGGNPNSATSQFFVNLSNNSANLDAQNGGFSVFGQVLGDGMDVVDEIAALSRFNFGGTFNEIPLQNFSAANATNGVIPTDNNLVIISDIVVVDAAVDTNTDLNPIANTIINAPADDDVPSSDGGGGGSMGLLMIFGLAIVAIKRRLTVTAAK